MGVNSGSLLWSAVSLTPLTTKKVNFIVKYLCEYEAKCKKALTRGSGAQIELFDEKPEVKNLVTGSTKMMFSELRKICQSCNF
jgi:hypothetical protein